MAAADAGVVTVGWDLKQDRGRSMQLGDARHGEDLATVMAIAVGDIVGVPGKAVAAANRERE